MELAFASTSVIAIVIFVVLFILRSSIKRIISTTNKGIDQINDVVVVNILESKLEIDQRVKEVIKKFDELGGPVNIEAAYNTAMGKNKK